MVQLTLPENSCIKPGKTWPKPASGTRLTEFRTYRRNPDDGPGPRIDTYFIDRDDCGTMVLEALIWIKSKIDSTAHLPPLLPRRRIRLLRDKHRRRPCAEPDGKLGHDLEQLLRPRYFLRQGRWIAALS